MSYSLVRGFKPQIKARCKQNGQRGKRTFVPRKDGKYLIYLPKDLAEDSMFPFKGSDSVFVKVSFKPKDAKRLLIKKWKKPLTE
ncbi:hypothetical protein E3J49_03690 [Candidatus Bathyarchaeota archaeon]|nr:MAG: hypothetical protein E3J49_03690 [Candidatus Bathyarchaeota archaeon]